jgi:hypothetical protein
MPPSRLRVFPPTWFNARHGKNVPGRKTDSADAEWLAQLGRFGRARPSQRSPDGVHRNPGYAG